MRSRYSAYVNQNADYLLATWYQDTRPKVVQLNQQQRWLGLKVYGVVKGQSSDDDGTVEFVARYKIDGKGFRSHEISQFIRQQGRWYYVSGEVD